MASINRTIDPRLMFGLVTKRCYKEKQCWLISIFLAHHTLGMNSIITANRIMVVVLAIIGYKHIVLFEHTKALWSNDCRNVLLLLHIVYMLSTIYLYTTPIIPNKLCKWPSHRDLLGSYFGLTYPLYLSTRIRMKLF